MQGEESLSFVEPDLSPDQAEVLRNSASNVPEFKNKMAKQVLKAITHKPQKFEQIPSLLVATSFGGDFKDETGSPNDDKGVRDLKRKFEDNEADIITELYARHFKNKTDEEMSRTERVPIGRATQDGSLAPNDSIGEVDFHTDIEEDHRERRPTFALRRGS